jgi:hypothetical protein
MSSIGPLGLIIILILLYIPLVLFTISSKVRLNLRKRKIYNAIDIGAIEKSRETREALNDKTPPLYFHILIYSLLFFGLYLSSSLGEYKAKSYSYIGAEKPFLVEAIGLNSSQIISPLFITVGLVGSFIIIYRHIRYRKESISKVDKCFNNE